MSSYRKFSIIMIACIFGVLASTASVPAHANGWGAFVGGVAAARIAGNIRAQTQAQQEQAYQAQQQTAIAQAQAAPRQASPEQRIKQLDKLAAGGYITPKEYKAKKQEIVNSM
jgi:membrane protease subunit (stomatin/prohibitin family)